MASIYGQVEEYGHPLLPDQWNTCLLLTAQRCTSYGQWSHAVNTIVFINLILYCLSKVICIVLSL